MELVKKAHPGARASRPHKAWHDHGYLPHFDEAGQDALLHFDGGRYRLLAWVIMPNHLHAVVETLPGFPLDGVIHSWKSFTAKRANRLLGRTGAFWMGDYFDRYVRDEAHLWDVMRYMEENPVKAGLVRLAREWPWMGGCLQE